MSLRNSTTMTILQQVFLDSMTIIFSVVKLMLRDEKPNLNSHIRTLAILMAFKI